MMRLAVSVVLLVMAASALMSAGPTIVLVANALVPLVLVIGLVAGVLRLVWHFTRGY